MANDPCIDYSDRMEGTTPARIGVTSLTEREKQALRLLADGHDVKSAARSLDLSVHTINERLRDARRKLEVSSSREAARILAATESDPPLNSGDRKTGVAVPGGRALSAEPPDRPRGASSWLVWFGGGMIVMSLLIAVAALSAVMQGTGSSARDASPAATNDPAGQPAARQWLALLDGGRWEESWRAAAPLFTSQLTAAQWATAIRPVRDPLGPVASRTLRGAKAATTLPGAPTGEYVVMQFATDFAARKGAVETVTVMRDRGTWKVAGYFIR